MLCNFFAFVRVDNSIVVKRIRVEQRLQNTLTGLFQQQKSEFYSNIDEHVDFVGGWKPDENQLLCLYDVPGVDVMHEAIRSNASSYDDLDLVKFHLEPVKAIFTGYEENGKNILLIQQFRSNQALSRSRVPIIGLQHGNVFSQMTGDMFTLGSRLVSIVEDNKVLFSSYSNLRAVFDLKDVFAEATKEGIEEFVRCDKFYCEDEAYFYSDLVDSQVSKMIHGINSSGRLDALCVDMFQVKAMSFPEVPVVCENGRIVLPGDKKSLKLVLDFMLENIYEAAFSGERRRSNSSRPLSV